MSWVMSTKEMWCISDFDCVPNKKFLMDVSGLPRLGSGVQCTPWHVGWVMTPGGVWGTAKAVQQDGE